MDNLFNKDIDFLWHPYTQMSSYKGQQIFIEKADDCFVYDSESNEYIDGISGLWNVNCGHNRKEIIDSIYEQLKAIDYYPLNGSSYQSAVKLAAQLVEISPEGLNKVFYCNSGAEATESAMKIAKAFWKNKGKTNKHKIISLFSGWHGCTMGALSASHIPAEKVQFEPFPGGYIKVPNAYCYRCQFKKEFPSCELACVDYISETIKQEDASTIAAFIAEPIQGLGGVIQPPEGYWKKIKQICSENEILLIIDEVATGFGRTGRPFAISHWGVSPDLLCCSKGITSGYLPLSAVLAQDFIYNEFLEKGNHLQHGFTTGGHPASCAAAVTNIEIMTREKLMIENERSKFLNEKFKKLEELDIVGNIRGKGFMIGIELVENKTTKEPFKKIGEVCSELKNNGLLVRPINNVIPFFPPLTISIELIEKAFSIYHKVLTNI